MNDPFYFGQLLYLHAEILSAKLYLPIRNSYGMFKFGPANKDRHKTKSQSTTIFSLSNTIRFKMGITRSCFHK